MKRVAVGLFLTSVFILSFLPVKDTDFGWHYRCGNQFLTSGKPCLSNQFSYLLPNYQAYNPSFLYDISLAFVYNRFGFLGVSLLGAAVLTLSALFLIKVFNGPLSARFIAVYLSFWLSYSVFNLGLRSQMVSFLFFVITVFILNHWRSPTTKLILPFLLLIWVNSHIGFFLGLILLAFFILTHPKIFYFLFFIFCFLTTFLNPFGPKVYLEIFRHFHAPLDTMIAEWVGPPLWQKTLITGLAILTLTLTLGSNRQTANGKEIAQDNLFDISLVLFFTVLALYARRNLPFFYTVCLYRLLKTQFFNKVFSNLFKESLLLLSLLLSITFTFSVINIPQTIKFDQSWQDYCHQGLINYPCRALEKTNLKKLSGNLFTSYEWGGFLIWQTPQLKVFADGRMSAWQDKQGNYPYQVYLYIIQGRQDWHKKLNQYHTDYLLIGNGTFLDLELQKKADRYGWKESYRDEVAVFYTKI